MRPTLHRPGLGLVLVALLLTLTPARADAQVGVGAFPEQIVVDGALRGGDYLVGRPQVTVLYPDGGEVLTDTATIAWTAVLASLY